MKLFQIPRGNGPILSKSFPPQGSWTLEYVFAAWIAPKALKLTTCCMADCWIYWVVWLKQLKQLKHAETVQRQRRSNWNLFRGQEGVRKPMPNGPTISSNWNWNWANCIQLLSTARVWIYRRKFRSETSDNMDSWKAEVRRVRRDKIRRKKMQMREKIGKSRFTVFFQWFVAPEGRKVGSLKRRVRSQLARWDMKKCTPLWREAHFQVKMDKTLEERTTFGSWDVEKVHAVVARSTFWSQNAQNTPWSDHFWKLRCRKSARRCGAKHILKSKCTKHTNVGPLLEVPMSKKCTPLWREAHFQVKSVKNWRSRTTFGGSDVEKVSKKCTPLWREAHFEVKSVKTEGFEPFLTWRCRKSRHWLT